MALAVVSMSMNWRMGGWMDSWETCLFECSVRACLFGFTPLHSVAGNTRSKDQGNNIDMADRTTIE